MGKRNSQDVVVQALGGLISKSTLWWYEHGRVPEAHALAALADLYDVDRATLLDTLVASIQNGSLSVDKLWVLACHGGADSTESSKDGAPHVEARVLAKKLRALERDNGRLHAEVEFYEEIVGRVEAITKDLQAHRKTSGS